MSCQLTLIARINDLKAARRYLFPCQKEISAEGIFRMRDWQIDYCDRQSLTVLN